MTDDAEELKRRYEEFARSLDHGTTASDYHLGELEIDIAARHSRSGMAVADVGCGWGYVATTVIGAPLELLECGRE